MRRSLYALILAASLLGTAVSSHAAQAQSDPSGQLATPDADTPSPSTPSPSTLSPSPPSLSTPNQAPMSQPIPPFQLVPPRGAQSPVELARASAAQASGASLDQISVVDVQAAEWSDLGLGCRTASPRRAFAQMMVPGFIVELDAAGTRMTYHTDAGLRAILCDSPAVPQSDTSP